MVVKRILKAGAMNKLKREKAKAKRKRESAADAKQVQNRLEEERRAGVRRGS